MVSTASKVLKALKIVLWSILGAILLFVFIVVGTLLVQKYVKKSPVPMFAGYGYLIVTSGSMSPTINKGDLIIVKKADEFKPGNIVTFKNEEGEIVTHRIINYLNPDDKTVFTTMGDYTQTPDINPVSADEIYAVWVCTIPKVGMVFEWFLHEGGIIYVIAFLAVIVAGVYFLNLTKSEPSAKAENSASADAQGVSSAAETDALAGDSAAEENTAKPDEDGK